MNESKVELEKIKFVVYSLIKLDPPTFRFEKIKRILGKRYVNKKGRFGKMFRAHHIFKEDNIFLLNFVNKYRAYLKTFAISIKYTWISKEDEYSFYKKKEVFDFTFFLS